MRARERKEATVKRLAQLAIPVTALVCLFGFWRLSPGLTFAIATAAFVMLVAALWIAGKD
jgi:uncharacterized membrane protein YhhN